MSKHFSLLSLLGLIAALAACGGPTIPLAAHRGSTFALPIASDIATDIGYASELTESFGDFDLQRPKLHFALCSTGGCSSDPNSVQHWLTTRYVTSMEASRASRAAIENRIVLNGGINFPLSGQAIAIVDIPLEVNADPNTGTNYALELWAERDGVFTPFAPTHEFGTLKVLDEPQDSTPFDAFFGGVQFPGSSDELHQIVPLPTLVLQFNHPGTPNPAAATLELDYPTQKVRIRSAHETTSQGQGSIVRLSHSNGCFGPFDDPGHLSYDPNFFASCVSQFGWDDTTTVHLIDPDQRTWRTGIAFELRDPNTTVDISEFSISSSSSYDPNGFIVSDPWTIFALR